MEHPKKQNKKHYHKEQCKDPRETPVVPTKELKATLKYSK